MAVLKRRLLRLWGHDLCNCGLGNQQLAVSGPFVVEVSCKLTDLMLIFVNACDNYECASMCNILQVSTDIYLFIYICTHTHIYMCLTSIKMLKYCNMVSKVTIELFYLVAR